MKNIFKKIIINILRLESRLVLWKYQPKIVAITGSVGKTSTKDAIYAVLSKFTNVRKSEKSFNSEIGLPLTILGCKNVWSNSIGWFNNILRGLWLVLYPHKYPKWLVLEVGIGKAGDMQATASWLRTNVVVVTAIGDTPAHIEFFTSRKHLIEEKSELIKTLKKDGILVLNADDEDVLNMKIKTKCLTTTYGFKDNVKDKTDILASGENILYSSDGAPAGVIYRIDEEGNSLPVSIEGVFGKNHIYATLAALTIASVLKLNMVEAADALKNYEVSSGRMRLLQGIKKTLIIDDTYNSSPFALESALKTLAEIKFPEKFPEDSHEEARDTGRKIAILGDMLELGRHTLPAHQKLGKIAKGIVDVLVVVGQRAQGFKEGAIEAGMNPKNIHEFSDSTVAGEFLKNFINKNDIILIKGSQGMRMERVVEAILLDQENKSKLLVRQNAEWKMKL